MSVKDETIVIVHESLTESIMGDIFTFSMLIGCVWFNNQYVGGSVFLNGVLLFMMIMGAFARFRGLSKRFTSREAAIEFLKGGDS